MMRAVLLAVLLAGCSGPRGTVTTVAGGLEPAYADGAGRTAGFNSPAGLVVADDGSIYVADSTNNAIRRVTPEGVVSTLVGANGAGHVDGPALAALLFVPVSLALDDTGNLLVGEGGNHDIRRVSLATGETTTIAGAEAGYVDGPLAIARFQAVTAVVYDASTQDIYLVDSGNHAVRRIDQRAGQVSTFAGNGESGSADGSGTEARFDTPVGLARDPGGTFWVSDTGNTTIRQITMTGAVTTIAGAPGMSGYAEARGGAARFARPWGVAFDVDRDALLVADSWNHVVREVHRDGTTRLAAGIPSVESPVPGGADGPADQATFRLPSGIAVWNAHVFVSEWHRLRRIDP